MEVVPERDVFCGFSRVQEGFHMLEEPGLEPSTLEEKHVDQNQINCTRLIKGRASRDTITITPIGKQRP